MRSVIMSGLLILAAGLCALGQSPDQPDGQVKPTPTPSTNSSGASSTQPASPSDAYTRPSVEVRRKRFVNSMVGPWMWGRAVFNAGISTWRNSPEEWGDTWEGFGRRVASNVGKNAIRQTTTYALDEAFKLDSHFYRSKKRDVGSRVKNALISPVTARDKNGKRVFGGPRLAGAYASNIIAYEAWYPDRYDWKDGVRSGTISLGFNAAFNLFKEFVLKK